MLASLQDVKTLLGLTTTDDDAYLNMQLDQVSAAVETYCQRSFLAGDDTFTIHNPNGDTLVLPLFPVNTLTSVTGDGVAVDSTEYLLNNKTGELHYIGTNTFQWAQWTDIVVQYNGGFTTVPFDIQRVVQDIVIGRYKQRNDDPTKRIKSEQIQEVGSTVYEGMGMAAVGATPMLSILYPYNSVLDYYRGEGAIVL